MSFPASLSLRAKKDDYWTKIIRYNAELHEIEQKELVNKKRDEKLRLREMLAEQQRQQKSISNDEHMRDQKLMDTILNKNKLALETEKKNK